MLFINNMNLILASSSPRRIQLLKEQGYCFTIVEPDFIELNTNNHIHAQELVMKNSLGKANSVSVLNDLILGKPGSKDEALQMLLALNNNTHSVLTAYTIIKKSNNIIEVTSNSVVESLVTFGNFNRSDFIEYVKSSEPNGKAGAYAIQGFGSRFVEKISGSYTNIVGLPMFEVMRDLNLAGVKYPWE